MQAVILCGGEGVRLRPLTENIPKPLVRILGVSALERCLRALSDAGFTEASLCTFYKSEMIEKSFGEEFLGMKIRCCREEYPLGTAGCVRKAFGGEDLLILSGDGVTGFDYRKIADFHAKNSADITIVTARVEDPREYGLVTERNGRVTGFIEKPGYDKCITDLANTGCYVISGEIIKEIPEGEKLDFAKDIFPAILERGGRIFAYKETGYWFDIGDIPSLLECQRELLGNGNFVPEGFDMNGLSISSSVLEEGATLGKGSRAVSSLIMKNSRISSGADLSEAVIGESCTVGEGLIMMKNSVIGDGCVVGKNVTVAEGVRIAGGTRIQDNAYVRTDINRRKKEEFGFDDGGIITGISSPHEAMKCGSAIATALGLKNITVCGSGGYAEALSLGARSAGADADIIDGGSLGEGIYVSRKTETGYILFISDEKIRLIDSYRYELSRSDERKIASAYNRFEFTPAKTGRERRREAEREEYIKSLKELIGDGEDGMIPAAEIRTDSEREREIFGKIFGDVSGGMIFTEAPDGMSVSAIENGESVPYEKLLILCAKACGERGIKITVPHWAPALCDRYAVTSREPSHERRVSEFTFDPMYLIALAAGYLKKHGKSLSEAAGEIPEIIYRRQVIEADRKSIPKLLGSAFTGARAGEEISIESEGAKAYIRPQRSGKAVRLYIEALSTEAAASITEEMRRRLGMGG